MLLAICGVWTLGLPQGQAQSLTEQGAAQLLKEQAGGATAKEPGDEASASKKSRSSQPSEESGREALSEPVNHAGAESFAGLALFESVEIVAGGMVLSPQGPILTEQGVLMGVEPVTLTLQVSTARGVERRKFAPHEYKVTGYNKYFTIASVQLDDRSIRLVPIEKSTARPGSYMPVSVVGYRNSPDGSGARRVPCLLGALSGVVKDAPVETGYFGLDSYPRRSMAGSVVADEAGKVMGIWCGVREAWRHKSVVPLIFIRPNDFMAQSPASARDMKMQVDLMTVPGWRGANNEGTVLGWYGALLGFAGSNQTPEAQAALADKARKVLPVEVARKYLERAAKNTSGGGTGGNGGKGEVETDLAQQRVALAVKSGDQDAALREALNVWVAMPSGERKTKRGEKALKAAVDALQDQKKDAEELYMRAWGAAEGLSAGMNWPEMMQPKLRERLEAKKQGFSLAGMAEFAQEHERLMLRRPVRLAAGAAKPQGWIPASQPVTVTFDGPAAQLSLAGGGKTLLALSGDGKTLWVYDLVKLKMEPSITLDQSAGSIAGDGTKVACLSSDQKRFWIVDLQTSKVEQEFTRPKATGRREIFLCSRPDLPGMVMLHAVGNQRLEVVDMGAPEFPEAKDFKGTLPDWVFGMDGDGVLDQVRSRPLPTPGGKGIALHGTPFMLAGHYTTVPGEVCVLDPFRQCVVNRIRLPFEAQVSGGRMGLLGAAASDRMIAAGPKENQVTVADLGVLSLSSAQWPSRDAKAGGVVVIPLGLGAGEAAQFILGPDGAQVLGGDLRWAVPLGTEPGCHETLIRVTGGAGPEYYRRINIEVVR